jgi:hypothetical protein
LLDALNFAFSVKYPAVHLPIAVGVFLLVGDVPALVVKEARDWHLTCRQIIPEDSPK